MITLDLFRVDVYHGPIETRMALMTTTTPPKVGMPDAAFRVLLTVAAMALVSAVAASSLVAF